MRNYWTPRIQWFGLLYRRVWWLWSILFSMYMLTESHIWICWNIGSSQSSVVFQMHQRFSFCRMEHPLNDKRTPLYNWMKNSRADGLDSAVLKTSILRGLLAHLTWLQRNFSCEILSKDSSTNRKPRPTQCRYCRSVLKGFPRHVICAYRKLCEASIVSNWMNDSYIKMNK